PSAATWQWSAWTQRSDSRRDRLAVRRSCVASSRPRFHNMRSAGSLHSQHAALAIEEIGSPSPVDAASEQGRPYHRGVDEQPDWRTPAVEPRNPTRNVQIPELFRDLAAEKSAEMIEHICCDDDDDGREASVESQRERNSPTNQGQRRNGNNERPVPGGVD